MLLRHHLLMAFFGPGGGVAYWYRERFKLSRLMTEIMEAHFDMRPSPWPYIIDLFFVQLHV